MQKDHLIALDVFCVNHNIEISFISLLHQNGLIEITTIEETSFIEASQLQQLEKFVRFYNDLDINIEGIETITHLMERMSMLQNEIIMLRNRLQLYETPS
ncbi:MAG: chaperone modulator CbpM [Bacteroidales bacterium]